MYLPILICNDLVHELAPLFVLISSLLLFKSLLELPLQSLYPIFQSLTLRLEHDYVFLCLILDALDLDSRVSVQFQTIGGGSRFSERHSYLFSEVVYFSFQL